MESTKITIEMKPPEEPAANNLTRPINIPLINTHHINYDESPLTPNFPNTPPPTPELSSVPPPSSISNVPEAAVPPNWLNSKYIENALRTKYPDLEVNNLHIKPAVNFGENYMSLVFRADVGTNQGPFGLIIKCIPETEFRAKFVTENEMSKREIIIYESILPKLSENIDESHKPLTPMVYYLFHDGPKDVIILQDLRPYGFRTFNRKIGLDKIHCTLALKELAKLHALSIKYRLEKPELFKKEIFEGFVENMYKEENREMFSMFLGNALTSAANGIRDFFPFRYHEIANILEQLSDHSFDLMLDIFKFTNKDKILVLNHGDFWTNNILFQYDTTENINPLACCLIDFQIAKCGPPVLDLQYFFYTSTTQEIRVKYLDELLQMYLDTVYQVLKETGVNIPLPKNIFYNSLEELKKEIKDYALFGLISAVLIMPVVVAEVEDAPDMDKMTEENLKTDLSTFEKLYSGALFQKRFREVLDDFDNLGFFNNFQELIKDINAKKIV